MAAVFAHSIPLDCSLEAALISALIERTRLARVTISSIDPHAFVAFLKPRSTLGSDSPTRASIIFAATAIRYASAYTLAETTAKPLLFSPRVRFRSPH
ncbi:hypothetical protein WS68_24030 [Burkholderia sp. TSV86]|nr:hypothetical protein WS68_24030 [Burkholderia sp. TSV86]